jgi:alkaline phosphatase
MMRRCLKNVVLASVCVGWSLLAGDNLWSADHLRQLQTEAVVAQRAEWGHWGPQPDVYSSCTSHTNRLVPLYTFGIGLDAVTGKNSVYRDPQRLEQLYGRLPAGSHNPQADYCDQTDIAHLQAIAAAAGKKHIILMIFDGMDWQTSQAAAIYRTGRVFREGRGSGLAIMDYRGAPTSFGYTVTSPHNGATKADVDSQTVKPGAEADFGGYDAALAGATPWDTPRDPLYLIGKSALHGNSVTDSAAAATAMVAGVKTYNDAINVDARGMQVVPIAHQLQNQGFAIGVVTSVPISHATPACAYAHNVHRDDYQDLTRDMLGLPSVAHPQAALKGVDVLLGAGWGDEKSSDAAQGTNFVPGNRYVAQEDLQRSDVRHGMLSPSARPENRDVNCCGPAPPPPCKENIGCWDCLVTPAVTCRLQLPMAITIRP